MVIPMHKIAIIEDDPTMLSLLHTLLQMEGYQVIAIQEENPSEIMEIFRSEQPNLALIDVHLRQGNGLELLQAMKKLPEHNDIRVIMSSGMDFSAQCFEAKADNFILKPYMPDELIDMIQKMLSS
jgi:DNA-binding response OmpR family regulator